MEKEYQTLISKLEQLADKITKIDRRLCRIEGFLQNYGYRFFE